jgi:hypothetical protein
MYTEMPWLAPGQRAAACLRVVGGAAQHAAAGLGSEDNNRRRSGIEKRTLVNS